jgi:hypothetical protein
LGIPGRGCSIEGLRDFFENSASFVALVGMNAGRARPATETYFSDFIQGFLLPTER